MRRCAARSSAWSRATTPPIRQRASILALREEWMGGDRRAQGAHRRRLWRADRFSGGASAAAMASTIRLGAVVPAIEDGRWQDRRPLRRWRRASMRRRHPHRAAAAAEGHRASARPTRERAARPRDIGFGNVIKLLLRFDTAWWRERQNELADLTFVLSERKFRCGGRSIPANLPCSPAGSAARRRRRWLISASPS